MFDEVSKIPQERLNCQVFSKELKMGDQEHL